MAERAKKQKLTAPDPFAIKDCALISLATGKSAQTLRELKDRIETADEESLYYHFWGGLLRPSFDDPEYSNDFASWVYHSLHEPRVAERLSVLDPSGLRDLAALREELIDVLEESLEERESGACCRPENKFTFIKSQIVIFDTGRRIRRPRSLAAAVAGMSIGSIFYHFVDARRRTPNSEDDFRAWLSGFGEAYGRLIVRLGEIDPFFSSLTELKAVLVGAIRRYFQEKTE